MTSSFTVPPLVQSSLADDTLAQLVRSEGRPITVAYPSVAHDAAKEFAEVLAAQRITGQVYAAHKATQSQALVHALAGTVRIDVASRAELHCAIAAGFSPAHIIATGPKSRLFLQELSKYPDITIVLDSDAELARLANIPQATNPVLLRMSRSMLNAPGVRKLSRFGMDEKGFMRAVARLENQTQFTVRGVAFHLDSQSLDERAEAVWRGTGQLFMLQRVFPEATVLDIGGGYGAAHGMTTAQLEQFERDLKTSLDGQRALTWNRFSYGLTVDPKGVRGSVRGIDAPRGPVGVDRLEELLARRRHGSTLADQLRENLIELWLEPGAAIFHSAGVIAAEIIEVRQVDEAWQVVVDIHRNQLCFEGNETLHDPVLLSASTGTPTEDTYLLLGNLCAESDVLSYRMISLPHHPQAGDVLVWTHTGAYRSHFSASRAIGHELARQYVYANGEFTKEEYDIHTNRTTDR